MRCLVGTDVEEVVRFRRILDRKPRLLSGLFFAQELETTQNAMHLDQTLTGYWCAKEAVVKAFAPVLTLQIRQVEILKDPAGYPKAHIHHANREFLSFSLTISISHTRNYATATAFVMLGD
jgi:holo-[acyl-carrier protein] synthase